MSDIGKRQAKRIAARMLRDRIDGWCAFGPDGDVGDAAVDLLCRLRDLLTAAGADKATSEEVELAEDPIGDRS